MQAILWNLRNIIYNTGCREFKHRQLMKNILEIIIVQTNKEKKHYKKNNKARRRKNKKK